MATRVYATTAQVKELVGIDLQAGPPANRTLRRASRVVDRILKGAVYDVDEAGLPTVPAVQDLLAEMTAEVVAWFDELGDETGVAAAGGGTIGRVTLPTVGRGRASGAQVMEAPNAVALARSSDLLQWRVYH